MFMIPNALVVTEIEALRTLAGVNSRHVASGGIGECAGAVVIVAEGAEDNVRKAISIIEKIKGEPVIPISRDVQDMSLQMLYCRKDQGDLPEWLRD